MDSSGSSENECEEGLSNQTSVEQQKRTGKPRDLESASSDRSISPVSPASPRSDYAPSPRRMPYVDNSSPVRLELQSSSTPVRAVDPPTPTIGDRVQRSPVDSFPPGKRELDDKVGSYTTALFLPYQ